MAHKRRSFLSGAAAALALLAAVRLYDRRVRNRIPGQEGIEDPAVSAGYGLVSRMPWMALMRRLVADRAACLAPTGQAVDLGCGPGYLVMEMARRSPGMHITGVDLSPEMLAQARASAETAGLAGRVAFLPGDAGQIPFPDGSLDLVVSTLSLHHWSDPAGVLDEIARVLRPGGAFMIVDLRRDLAFPFYLLIWFATQFVVPAAIHRINEPMGSRNAAYTVEEAAELLRESRLAGGRVSAGPLWLLIQGRVPW